MVVATPRPLLLPRVLGVEHGVSEASWIVGKLGEHGEEDLAAHPRVGVRPVSRALELDVPAGGAIDELPALHVRVEEGLEHLCTDDHGRVEMLPQPLHLLVHHPVVEVRIVGDPHRSLLEVGRDLGQHLLEARSGRDGGDEARLGDDTVSADDVLLRDLVDLESLLHPWLVPVEVGPRVDEGAEGIDLLAVFVEDEAEFDDAIGGQKAGRLSIESHPLLCLVAHRRGLTSPLSSRAPSPSTPSPAGRRLRRRWRPCSGPHAKRWP